MNDQKKPRNDQDRQNSNRGNALPDQQREDMRRQQESGQHGGRKQQGGGEGDRKQQGGHGGGSSQQQQGGGEPGKKAGRAAMADVDANRDPQEEDEAARSLKKDRLGRESVEG